MWKAKWTARFCSALSWDGDAGVEAHETGSGALLFVLTYIRLVGESRGNHSDIYYSCKPRPSIYPLYIGSIYPYSRRVRGGSWKGLVQP